jgi:hypothetical protein
MLLHSFGFECAQIPRSQARRQRALRLHYVRDQARPPDYVPVSHGIELADPMLADPAADALIGPAGELRGLLNRQESITVQFVGTRVEKRRKLAQLGGKGGAGLKWPVVDIGRQLGNQIGGGGGRFRPPCNKFEFIKIGVYIRLA